MESRGSLFFRAIRFLSLQFMHLLSRYLIIFRTFISTSWIQIANAFSFKFICVRALSLIYNLWKILFDINCIYT